MDDELQARHGKAMWAAHLAWEGLKMGGRVCAIDGLGLRLTDKQRPESVRHDNNG